MQLIPSTVLQHLANPAQIEKLFISYIEKAGLQISNSKTIAGVAYYDIKTWAVGALSTKFFTGNYNPLFTNVPNSFVRPESEHFLIWAIRVETNTTGEKAVFVPGTDASGFLNNTQMTLTTNSEVKLKKFPLSEALSDLTTRDNGLIPLAEPIFWGGQQEMEIEVVNGRQDPAPANQFMKITLIGLALI